jgi:2-polyprenyl-3-methyl-5-hydroxy-6-metoxy-1,4-benzoquinol methylase
MREMRHIPNPKLVDKETEILSRVAGRSVLHVGLGGFVDDDAVSSAYVSSDLTRSFHGRLANVAAELVGIDINPLVLEAMKAALPGEYALCDVTNRGGLPALRGRQFDAIVFGDVLEHVDDFKTALANLTGVLRPDGALIISTVNAYSIDAIVKLLFRYESVHEEHTAYFSFSTLRRLLQMNGIEIIDFMYYTINDVERFDSWPHRIGFRMSSLFVRAFPQYAMGVMAITRPASSAERRSPAAA